MRPATTRLALTARALLPVYLILVALIVFSPADDSGTGFLDQLGELLGEPAYVALEFTANIAMFVPFGVLVRIAFTRVPWWVVLLLGLATTVTIELVQTTLPSRYSTVSDVVANTLGTAAGLLVVRAFSRRR
jgi:glycopeptide antibiotics resistance protein